MMGSIFQSHLSTFSSVWNFKKDCGVDLMHVLNRVRHKMEEAHGGLSPSANHLNCRVDLRQWKAYCGAAHPPRRLASARTVVRGPPCADRLCARGCPFWAVLSRMRFPSLDGPRDWARAA